MSRLTFPKIESKFHPLADGSRVALSVNAPIQPADAKDLMIAKEIIDVHKTVRRRSSADGEWKWINQHRRKEYLEALDRGDANVLAEKLSLMFRNDVTFGVITSHFEELNSPDRYKELESAVLLDIDAWKEFTEQDETALPLMAMPKTGNPYGAMIGNHIVSADCPRHDYFSLKLKKLLGEQKKAKPVILEIGGGYGGLALQILRRVDKVCYLDCDLMESLYIAYYFIRKSTDRTVVWALDGIPADAWKADVIMVPAHNYARIDGSIDVVFNANSLSEMSRETIDGYIGLVHRLMPSYFLHQNSNFLLFPNSERHIETLASQFPINPMSYEEIYRSIAPWQGAGGRYREFLYRRRSSLS
jgi:hypothetical protein